MKVEQPDLRRVEFDCPWTGHLLADFFQVRNPAMPSFVGRICVKCNAMIWVMEPSPIVGPGGEALPAAVSEPPKGD